jgi:hypothetical protein
MNLQPIGYQYPQNYVNINVASPDMDLQQCKKHTMYECDGTFYVKQPEGCQFVPTDGSPDGAVITSPYRRRWYSPRRHRFGSPYRHRFGSPYRHRFGSPIRPKMVSPSRPRIVSPFKRR